MKNKLKTIWDNKKNIFEGIKNKLFKKENIEELAKQRLEICRSNVCGFYDKEGKGENVIIKGSESCNNCGCNLELKTRCLHCACPIKLWDAVASEEDSEKILDLLNKK
jgi:hypothetical protein